MGSGARDDRARPGSFVWLLQASVLAVLYVGSGKAGLHFVSYPADTTLVWPASGLALAALLVFGTRLWPALFVGALALNRLETQLEWLPSIAIAIGNTLDGVVPAVLLSRRGFRSDFGRLRDVLDFLRLGTLTGTFTGATIGVAAVIIAGVTEPAAAMKLWLVWWTTDILGVLVVTPAILLLSQARPSWRSLSERREWWVALSLHSAICYLAFSGLISGVVSFAATFAPLPFLVWASARLGPRGAVTMACIMIVTSIVATGAGAGPFALGDATEQVILLVAYTQFVGLTTYAMTTFSEQRNVAEARYRSEEASRTRIESEKTLLLERERLTREMHDGLGGQLVSALSAVERGADSPGEVAETLRQALDEIRIVIDSLDPETTDLPTSLGKLRARLSPLLQRNDIQPVWRVVDAPCLDRFAPDQTLHILRIVQEAVTNAMRHAGPDTVEVTVGCGPIAEDLEVTIRDDGCGLQCRESRGGRGMQNMHRRADALGGVLRAHDGNPGATIRLTVPIPD